MKGAVTLSVYVAIGLIPVVFGPAAVGQSSDGWTPPGWKRMEIAARPAPTPEHLKPVVMQWEPGGHITQHEYRFRSLASMGSPVEIRGACISACTLVMSYVPKERICFGEGSYLSFHAAVSSMETWAYNGEATKRMYQSYPVEIKAWIDGRGGWESLKPKEYWPLFARDLWAMGYAKCQ